MSKFLPGVSPARGLLPELGGGVPGPAGVVRVERSQSPLNAASMAGKMITRTHGTSQE